MKRAHPNWPSTFYHQQMRAQQCLGMIRDAEARRGVCYDWVARARPEFATGCACPPRQPLSPSRLYSIDVCNIRKKGPMLCDAFWLVPRQWVISGSTSCSMRSTGGGTAPRTVRGFRATNRAGLRPNACSPPGSSTTGYPAVPSARTPNSGSSALCETTEKHSRGWCIATSDVRRRATRNRYLSRLAMLPPEFGADARAVPDVGAEITHAFATLMCSTVYKRPRCGFQPGPPLLGPPSAHRRGGADNDDTTSGSASASRSGRSGANRRDGCRVGPCAAFSKPGD